MTMHNTPDSQFVEICVYCLNCSLEGVEFDIGPLDRVYRCQGCLSQYIGFPVNRLCNCGQRIQSTDEIGEVADFCRIEVSSCIHCQNRVALLYSLVSSGGVYYRCSNCDTEGAFESNSHIASECRRALGVPFAPCGVIIDGRTCPTCKQRRKFDRRDTVKITPRH